MKLIFILKPKLDLCVPYNRELDFRPQKVLKTKGRMGRHLGLPGEITRLANSRCSKMPKVKIRVPGSHKYQPHWRQS